MYSEWIAYEKFAGPIGPKYMYELQRATVELLRSANWMTGAQFKNNPAPNPKKPFPNEAEYMKPELEEDEEELTPDEISDVMETLATVKDVEK